MKNFLLSSGFHTILYIIYVAPNLSNKNQIKQYIKTRIEANLTSCLPNIMLVRTVFLTVDAKSSSLQDLL